ncbi:MAG: tRNA uridine-5-carboxymethylaminomethyl(34) synthesis GTPase MnmE [Deltaproteobacteria bacterium]|nr:tRNA uridine-5-carboxymethylaminomethyl(34) synthesis GTPase MnmE [Deltaproteobacteria bacterium]
MKLLEDTITAIATPQGEGGIGIIRISGNMSINIAAKIFVSKKSIQEFLSHHLYYGAIINPSNNAPIDDCLLAVMKLPHSYTGEDIVEIYCHGGSLILKRVLEAVLKYGARIAEPGEFTKRAFLNGRMDLLQAESVIDLIRAKTDLALNTARSHLSGRLSKEISMIKEDLVHILCYIEAELDFPEEEDVPRISDNRIVEVIKKSETILDKLLSTYEEGRILIDGLKVIIIGRTNVGKSSLLNCLLKEERAIVTPIPGTTRDIIEEVLNIRGIPVRLMDTAGIREPSDEVEGIGIRWTMDRLKKADMVLFIIDVSGDNISDDLKLFKRVYNDGKRLVIIFNKMDISKDSIVSDYQKVFSDYRIVKASALLEDGIEELKDAIYGAVAKHEGEEIQEIIITSLRHKTALDRAVHGLKLAHETVENNLSREFLAAEIKGALNAIGEIVGETTSDDILERIFSQFCIGK